MKWRGSIAYTPAAGEVLEVGTHTLTTAFTPLDATRYATATATVTISVNLGASDWQNPDNPLDSVFGTAPTNLPDPIEPIGGNSSLPYMDTNGDGILSPKDSLQEWLYPQVDGQRSLPL